MTNIDFWEWVDKEIAEHGLSYYAIEQGAGLGNATISRPARNRSQPSLTVCKAIAQVLQMREVDVLYRAGHIKQTGDPPPVTDISQAVCEAFRRLDARHQSAVSDIIFALAGNRTEHAPTVLPSWSGQSLEKEAAYSPDSPASAEQPARQSMVVDDPDQEVYQAFRRVLDLVWETAPREERGRYFLETAIEVMHEREHELESK